MTADDLTAIARALAPVLRDHLAFIQAKDRGLDGKEGPMGPEGRPGRDGLPGIPGRDGSRGEKGLDGSHGKDGIDGLGFEDMTASFDGQRTVTVMWIKGERTKSFDWVFPVVIYRETYKADQAYDAGDAVTWGGSLWIAKADTTAKPGTQEDASRAWVLAVKSGREGKAGPMGPEGKQGLRGLQGDRGPERWA